MVERLHENPRGSQREREELTHKSWGRSTSGAYMGVHVRTHTHLFFSLHPHLCRTGFLLIFTTGPYR